MNSIENPRPIVEVILLAAGASRRMQGRDKLLELIDGEPLLRRSAKTAYRSGVDRVHVVLPKNNTARLDALTGIEVNVVYASSQGEGMGFSIQSGMKALSGDCDAVIISLADMPDIKFEHYVKLASAYNPDLAQHICRAVTEDGKPGLPVLFGRRLFDGLANLRGDQGARELIANAPEFVVNVPTSGEGAIIDLDTAEDWTEWRKDRDTG